ncbi:MAG TPA: peptidoglycan-binding protein [Acidimicrobiia bacterium]
MRLYRLGDVGTPIRDIQERLQALGFDSSPDPRGTFGERTREAVIAFQKARGLEPDGIVGPETWRMLYEAGYRLGDRLLMLRRPMLRGEDVAQLQSHLSSLGFDCGKVDGIFGPHTERAVMEFQHNRGLAEDGRVGPEVLTELRLVTRAQPGADRQRIREREWLRSLPPTLAGTRVYLDAACRSPEEMERAWEAASAAAEEIRRAGGIPVMSRAEDSAPPERVRAGRANQQGSDVIVSFQETQEEGVFYFATEHTKSEAGQELAMALASVVGGVVEGRSAPILRETRAPAAVIARKPLNEELGRQVARALEVFLRSMATRP